LSLLVECGYAGCSLLTLGDRCALHAAPTSSSRFPRGRPLRPALVGSSPSLGSMAATMDWLPSGLTADGFDLLMGLGCSDDGDGAVEGWLVEMWGVDLFIHG